MALKIISQNIGFSLSNNDPQIATITGQLPSSVSTTPMVLTTGNPTIIKNFTPGQVTYTYITASDVEAAAIEAAVTIIPISTECISWD